MNIFYLNIFFDFPEFWEQLFADLFSLSTLIIVAGFLYKSFKTIVLHFRNTTELFPFYDTHVLRSSRRNYISTKCQNIDPSDQLNQSIRQAHITKVDLLDFFIKTVFSRKIPEDRFYLILADSGMGKTTFVFNLYYRLRNKFISLFFKYSYRILPLGESFETIKREIKGIQNPEKVILILDGLDESPLFSFGSDVHIHIERIIELVKAFRIVIITCRTHFFSSGEDEPYELKIRRYYTSGNQYHVIKKLYISPFDENDVKKYIRYKYKFWQSQKKKQALRIINDAPDLFVRPMLLDNIDYLTLNSDYKIKFNIYKTLVNRWIQRESQKKFKSDRTKFYNSLYHFSYAMCKFIYANYTKFGILIDLRVANVLAKRYAIDLTAIDVKSKSFLNRTALGQYKFSHKSIFEYLLSIIAFLTIEKKDSYYTVNYNISNFDQSLIFFKELIRRPSLLNNVVLPKWEIDINVKLEDNVQREIEWLDSFSFRFTEV